MFNNYNYFLVLCEEMNITRAAKKLFISHQSLSSYIRNLENEYGVSFFLRKPQLSLTPAGIAMRDALKEVEHIEQNFVGQISNIKDEKSGIINFGTTEGRYRIIVPPLLKEYAKIYPHVQIRTFSCKSLEMEQQILDYKIDVFLGFDINIHSNRLKSQVIAREQLYLIISDNLLKKYFSDTFPNCKKYFKKGVDLKLFQKVPFVLNKENFNSRIMIKKHLEEIGVELNCITELTQPDIHIMLCALDYAASFCFSMYIPGILQINTSNQYNSKINIFPILGITQTKTIDIFYLKDRIFPKYVLDFMKLLKNLGENIN